MDAARIDRSTGKVREYEPTPEVDELLRRSQDLVADLEAFQEFAAFRKCKSVDIRHFKSSVQSEERSLLKLSEVDQTASRTVHNLRSSNLPFYEAVWTMAKLSTRLTGLQKRFHWNKTSHTTAKGKSKKKSALVDVVAGDGLHWIKVSTMTESKLLFEKAKAGWEASEWNESSDNDDQIGKKIRAEGADPDARPAEESDDDYEGRIELVRVAQDLKRASLATRFQFKHPDVVIVLPNIERGSSDIINSILQEIEDTGVRLVCGFPEAKNGEETIGQSTFERMLPVFRPSLTETVNLDCTVLLALISDLSHGDVDKLVLPEKCHPSLSYQVGIERATPLLPCVMYPGLARAERFVTSTRSASRMWEIVKIIGTDSERQRAHLLFGTSEQDGAGEKPQQDPETLRRQLRDLSIHEVPNLPLPIILVESSINTVSHIPSRILGRVSGQLSDINRSVFMLGWTNGWTTVTSNQAAVKTIENTVTDELDRLPAKDDGDDKRFDGPLIWTIDIARSLVGKESGRAH